MGSSQRSLSKPLFLIVFLYLGIDLYNSFQSKIEVYNLEQEVKRISLDLKELNQYSRDPINRPLNIYFSVKRKEEIQAEIEKVKEQLRKGTLSEPHN